MNLKKTFSLLLFVLTLTPLTGGDAGTGAISSGEQMEFTCG